LKIINTSWVIFNVYSIRQGKLLKFSRVDQ